ncbi:metal-dependent hydrolase [Thioflexithrix psekupsensis]|uniref:Metal-dependent hydrolase n=1 Tax=Thioflexithrix psekupsensis TaxID=1570016 RepID=A0A251X760_9GAMM|nr:metal-dependent hydrolase [Thioflexithrix psekupsensis]OUD13909.1 hypothetical protein TPSD3_06080 [Thioflexithrix psekupsensis]
MANFQAHLSAAAALSGLASMTCLSMELVSPNEVFFLWGVGVIGGILPDVDSNHSTSLQLIFTLLATIIAFAASVHHIHYFSIVELWIIWGIVYALVRYVVIIFIKKLTLHRGTFHSLGMALLFGFIITVFSFRLLNANAVFAWLLGLFAAFGFTIHLLLDEANSIELKDKIRVKRSLGTAIKLLDWKDKTASVIMIISIILMFSLTPEINALKQLFNQNQWHTFSQNILPKERWFQPHPIK